MIDWFGAGIALVFGTVVGSFLNVCIYRMPAGKSIVKPGSYCPNCGNSLRPRDLVPLFSFLAQRCKCRYCGVKISWRYFTVELLTGLYFALLWIMRGPNIGAAARMSDLLAPGIEFAGLALFSAMMIAILFIDLDHMIIPDELSLGALALGLIRDAASYWIVSDKGIALREHEIIRHIPFISKELPVLGPLAWAIIFGGVLLIIAELGTRAFKKDAMGGGDIKLLAAFGANIAAGAVVVGFFMAVVLGTIVGVALIATRLRERRAEIPFGPMLVTGALVAQIWGLQLWEAYLKHTGIIA